MPKVKPKNKKVVKKYKQSFCEYIVERSLKFRKHFLVFVIAIFALSTIFSVVVLRLKTKAADNWQPLLASNGGYMVDHPFLSKIRMASGTPTLSMAYNSDGNHHYIVNPTRMVLNGDTYGDNIILNLGGTDYTFPAIITITNPTGSALLSQGPVAVIDPPMGPVSILSSNVSGARPIYSFLGEILVSGTRHKAVLFVEQLTDFETTRSALLAGGGFDIGNGVSVADIVAGVKAFDPPVSAPGDYIPILTADGNGGTTAVGTYVSSRVGYTDGVNDYRGVHIIAGVVSSPFDGQTFLASDFEVAFIKSEGSEATKHGGGSQNGQPVTDGSHDIYGIAVDYIGADTFHVLLLTESPSSLSAALTSPWANPREIGVLLTSGGAAGKDFTYSFSSAPPIPPAPTHVPTYTPQPLEEIGEEVESKVYTQEEYDELKAELETAQKTITDLQNQISQLKQQPQAPSSPVANPISGTDNSYTVRSGDYLYLISLKLYGSKDFWQKLVELNRDRYPSLATNPNAIDIGWVLYY